LGRTSTLNSASPRNGSRSNKTTYKKIKRTHKKINRKHLRSAILCWSRNRSSRMRRRQERTLLVRLTLIRRQVIKFWIIFLREEGWKVEPSEQASKRRGSIGLGKAVVSFFWELVFEGWSERNPP
jgi:hypothetical protein